MVAPYRVHKQRVDHQDDGFFRPWSSNPDSTERQRGKSEVKEGVQDHADYKDLLLRMEAQQDDEDRMAEECWAKEQDNPHNYRCTCYLTEDK